MSLKNKYRKRDFSTKNSEFKALPIIRVAFAAILIVMQSFAGIAQSTKHVITGKITSSLDAQSLPGVNIIVKGTTSGTTSDVNGNYSLEASDKDILVFSYIGYEIKEVEVGSKSKIDITLTEDIAKLSEVVVIGYGEIRRRDVTGAIASVNENEIKKTVSTSLDQAIQGRAAGVEVTQNSGEPGGGVSVRIRGVNSLNGQNEPLYVVDGIPIEGYTGDVKYNNSMTNVLAMINPSDIVSMEILKDASATAIYGSRAANGVILITTKRGQPGRTKISYEGYYAVQELPTLIEAMNLRDYAIYQNERARLFGFGAREEFANPDLLNEGTNWQKEMFRSAPMQNHQVSLSGGSEKTNFAFSGGYFSQDGIAIGSGFERFTLRFNLDNQTRDWLKIGTSVMASRSNQSITVSNNDLISSTLRQTPDVPAKNADGSWGGPAPNRYGAYTTNVVAEALLRENDRKSSQVIANVYAEIKLLKGLVFRNELGGTVSYANSYYFQPTAQFGEFRIPNSSSSRGANNSLYWITKNYLTYNTRFANKHDVTMMLGHESQENSWEGLSGSRINFFTNGVHELGAGDATTAQNGSNKGGNSMESYFGRLNYSFADKYLLTATLRADGSSRFGPKNKWGYFPSFAAAWKISNESFLKNIDQINNLKLRLGWGLVGGQNLGDYRYGMPLANYPTASWGTGVLSESLPNQRVKWESTHSSNIGIDLGLLNNRVEIIVDGYIKNTSNLLLTLPLPRYTGTSENPSGSPGAIGSPVENMGALENKGVEFTLNTINLDSRGLLWKTGLMLSFNKNKIVEMYSDNSIINRYVGTDIISRTIVGQPVGLFYGYVVDGMFNTEADFYDKDGQPVARPADKDGNLLPIAPNNVWLGDLRFKDISGPEGKPDGKITEADRTFIGNPNPKFQFGINNSFTYKNFDLTVFINGVYGNKIYNWTRRSGEDPGSNFGLLASVADFAKLDVRQADLTIDPATGAAKRPDEIVSNVYVTNAGTTMPRLATYSANGNHRISDRFVEDGSYIRIKNVVLGYTIPKQLINKVKVDAIRVYVNVQNLHTFTKYTGYDPEIGSRGQDPLLTAVDNFRYPTQRIYTVGLNVNF